MMRAIIFWQSAKVTKGWRDYLEAISTMELPHPVIPSIRSSFCGFYPSSRSQLTMEDVEAVLKNMKTSKATGPDGLAADR